MRTLAVCAETVFQEKPIEDRARRIHDAGFQKEIWDGEATGEMWIPAHRTLTRLAEQGESAGVTLTL